MSLADIIKRIGYTDNNDWIEFDHKIKNISFNFSFTNHLLIITDPSSKYRFRNTDFAHMKYKNILLNGKTSVKLNNMEMNMVSVAFDDNISRTVSYIDVEYTNSVLYCQDEYIKNYHILNKRKTYLENCELISKDVPNVI